MHRAVCNRRNTKIPPAIRRSGIILMRARRVGEAVHALHAGPLTRVRFKDRIEDVLTEAYGRYCRYLYARIVKWRTEAARCLDEVQGILEYELPLCLLSPVKGSANREKAVQQALSAVQSEAAHFWRIVPKMYEEHRRKKGKASSLSLAGSECLVASKKQRSAGRQFRRSAKRLFEEFSFWVNEVVQASLWAEETEAKHLAEAKYPNRHVEVVQRVE